MNLSASCTVVLHILLSATFYTILTLVYRSFFFFFNATAPTQIYTLSLHDALPILDPPIDVVLGLVRGPVRGAGEDHLLLEGQDRKSTRLNSSHGSISYAVFCLKKKKTTKRQSG